MSERSKNTFRTVGEFVDFLTQHCDRSERLVFEIQGRALLRYEHAVTDVRRFTPTEENFDAYPNYGFSDEEVAGPPIVIVGFELPTGGSVNNLPLVASTERPRSPAPRVKQ